MRLEPRLCDCGLLTGVRCERLLEFGRVLCVQRVGTSRAVLVTVECSDRLRAIRDAQGRELVEAVAYKQGDDLCAGVARCACYGVKFGDHLFRHPKADRSTT